MASPQFCKPFGIVRSSNCSDAHPRQPAGRAEHEDLGGHDGGSRESEERPHHGRRPGRRKRARLPRHGESVIRAAFRCACARVCVCVCVCVCLEREREREREREMT